MKREEDIKKEEDLAEKPGCSGIEEGGSPDSGASGESARLADLKVEFEPKKKRVRGRSPRETTDF